MQREGGHRDPEFFQRQNHQTTGPDWRRGIYGRFEVFTLRRGYFGGPTPEMRANIPDVQTRIITPGRLLKGEKTELHHPHEPQPQTDEEILSSETFTRPFDKFFTRVIDPLFWPATYGIRGAFWPKINAFYDHPEGPLQKKALNWALDYSLKDLIGSKRISKNRAPINIEGFTISPEDDKTYKQARLWGMSLTPVVGPFMSLVGLNIPNTFTAFKNGEIRRGLGFSAMTALDIIPNLINIGAMVGFSAIFAIKTIFEQIGFSGLALGGAVLTGANILGFLPFTNTFLSEPYQNAYSNAYSQSLLGITDFLLRQSQQKRNSLVSTVNSYLNVKARQNDNNDVVNFKANLSGKIAQERLRIDGNPEEGNLGLINTHKQDYTRLVDLIEQSKLEDAQRKQNRHFSLNPARLPGFFRRVGKRTRLEVLKKYFEREIVLLEQKSASLKIVSSILETATQN